MKKVGHLFFTKSHEWIMYEEKTTAIIGISDYAQEQLGDLVYVNLPEEGDFVTMGEIVADVESVKAVSDIYSPVTGIVSEINQELLDEPQRINEQPYQTWLVRFVDIEQEEDLMDEEEYERYRKELGKK